MDTIFTLCGGHIIDIYDGCIDEGIRIVDVRLKQLTAHAADGYARQTDSSGCVVTTAGPVRQCRDRHRDRVPLGKRFTASVARVRSPNGGWVDCRTCRVDMSSRKLHRR